ncbi:TnsA endonuclease N-terminal domain-containing protein [Pandoraea apista]|uniref:TnsA endonuclease N-terminal domain-containing protein n=1 Tax=Pandoraea apista TaxID=93218 RepID=UPI00248E854D|nr:TnsA endonuclease N-terminal domain-containing protein [Pandoraea apista]
MKILELPNGFSTPASPLLLWRDGFGVRHGSAYESIHSSRTPGWGTRGQIRSPKVERSMHLLSRGEIKAFLYFLYCPYVIDMREQYPIYNQDAFNRALMKGRRLNKSQCLTIDFMLTLALPPDNRPHTHWVSIKFDKTGIDDSDRRRAEREESNARARGETWEMLDSKDFPAAALRNFAALWTQFKFSRAWDLYADSKILANRILRCSLRGKTDDVMNRHARHMGISLDQAYQLLSTAVSFGHLWLDHRFIYSADRPLHLVPYHHD